MKLFKKIKEIVVKVFKFFIYVFGLAFIISSVLMMAGAVLLGLVEFFKH